MYNKTVLDIFYNPQNVGVIKGANGVGKVVDDTCGEIVKIYISVQDNKVVDAKFQTFGSPAIIAAASVAASLMIDKTLDECLIITSTQILEKLGGSLPASKKYVCPLAESVVKNAVANYNKKKDRKNDTDDEE